MADSGKHMTKSHRPAQAPDLTTRLEAVLAELIAAHRDMLALTQEHRAALSRADGAAVQHCVERQGVAAARIASIETERREVVAALAGPSRGAPVTITSLAQRLAEPARERIISLAGTLRDLLIALQREAAVVRAATQSLVSHMDGLMQQVARALSQARLYGPGGRIDPGGPVAGGLDLTH